MNKVLVYKTLRALMQEADRNTFEELHKKIFEQLLDDADTYAFAKYFEDTYSKRPELWAFYARVHLGISTNMHLESLYKILKYFYLDSRKTKRVDKILHRLMKFYRDKVGENGNE